MNASHAKRVRCHLRWMIRRDMPEVLAIESASFEYPWMENDFIRCLRQRNHIAMVAEHDGRIVGCMVYHLCRRKIDVLNFSVTPEMRRMGIGSQMVDKLIGSLSRSRRIMLTLNVSEHNVAAQLFFRSFGFQWIGTTEDFYEDGQDSYRMVYMYDYEKSSQKRSWG